MGCRYIKRHIKIFYIYLYALSGNRYTFTDELSVCFKLPMVSVNHNSFVMLKILSAILCFVKSSEAVAIFPVYFFMTGLIQPRFVHRYLHPAR